VSSSSVPFHARLLAEAFDLTPSSAFRFGPTSNPFLFMPPEFSFGRSLAMPSSGPDLHQELLKELKRGPQCTEPLVLQLIEEKADLLSDEGKDDVLGVALRHHCPSLVIESLLMAQAPLVNVTAKPTSTKPALADDAVNKAQEETEVVEEQLAPPSDADAPPVEPKTADHAQLLVDGEDVAATPHAEEVPPPQSIGRGDAAEAAQKVDNAADSLTTPQLASEPEKPFTAEVTPPVDAATQALALAQPRIAVLVADRGGRWARMAAESMTSHASKRLDTPTPVSDGAISTSNGFVNPKAKAENGRAKLDKLESGPTASAEQWRATALECVSVASRLAKHRPTGSMAELLHDFSATLLGPLVDCSDSGALEPSSWLGNLLKAMCAAQCNLTLRHVNRLAASIVARLADKPGEACHSVLKFVEFLLSTTRISTEDTAPDCHSMIDVSELASAFQRHGVVACLERLAHSGVNECPLSQSLPSRLGTSRSHHALREVAKRQLAQLQSMGAAEQATSCELHKVVESLSDTSSLEQLVRIVKEGDCTPFELGLLEAPEKILPLLEPSGEDWPWSGSTAASPERETSAALTSALQVLLSMCETFPVHGADWQSEGLDCLSQPLPLELTMQGNADRRSISVEPLLQLSELERFVLQTTPIEPGLSVLEWESCWQAHR
jgi:hypothetical protein